jgi:peptidoglycan/LPS O-acetylase OafA/YrhL
MKKPSLPSTPKIDAALSEKLVGVSFLTACFVVVLHAYSNSLLGSGLAADWFILFVGWTLPTFAVPIFFVISGYLFGVKSANGTAEGWYGKAVKKRLRTLLVPYFLWCTVFALTVIPFTVFGNHLAGRALTSNTCMKEPLVSVWNFFRIYGGDLNDGPACLPMWYIRNLFLLVLAAPLFLALTSNRWTGALYLAVSGGLFVAQNWLATTSSQLLETGLSLRGFFFFPLGLYLARHPVPDTPAFRRMRAALPAVWLATCLAFVVLRLHAGEEWQVAKLLTAKATNLLGVGAIWVLCDLLPGFRRMARHPVAKCSFFVYACHMGVLFTLMCERCQQLLMTHLHVPVVGIFLLRIAVPLGVSLLLAAGVKRWFPRAYAMLTGGR